MENYPSATSPQSPDVDDDAPLWLRLRTWRSRLKLTQSQLANLLGKQPGYVSMVEAGKAEDMPAEQVAAFAAALGITPEEFAQLPPPSPRNAPRGKRLRATPKGEMTSGNVKNVFSQLIGLRNEIDNLRREVRDYQRRVEYMSSYIAGYAPQNAPSPITAQKRTQLPYSEDLLSQRAILPPRVTSKTLYPDEAMRKIRELSNMTPGEILQETTSGALLALPNLAMDSQEIQALLSGDRAARRRLLERASAAPDRVIVAMDSVRAISNTSLETAHELSRYEALDGTRCLLLDGVSEVMIPGKIHEQRANILVKQKKLTREAADHILAERQTRWIALRRHLESMDYDVYDLCPLESLERLAFEGIPAMDDLLGRRGAPPLNASQRIAVLDNIIYCLERFPTYRIGVLKEPLTNNLYWFLKEGHAVILEALDDDRQLQEYEVTDGQAIYVFRRYFFSQLWEKLPGAYKGRRQMIRLLKDLKAKVENSRRHV